MSWPTEPEVRAQIKALAEAALGATQVLDSWPMNFEPRDDMTILRSNGRVDTLIIAGGGIGQEPRPKDSTQYIRRPRGRNVVKRLYRTWYFGDDEATVTAKIEAWRIKVNEEPVLGFAAGKAEFIDVVERLDIPVIMDFASGDPETSVGWLAQGFLTVGVIEPQG